MDSDTVTGGSFCGRNPARNEVVPPRGARAYRKFCEVVIGCGATGSGSERYALLWAVVVDVSVDRQQRSAYYCTVL
jgi:hypothetical protein